MTRREYRRRTLVDVRTQRLTLRKGGRAEFGKDFLMASPPRSLITSNHCWVYLYSTSLQSCYPERSLISIDCQASVCLQVNLCSSCFPRLKTTQVVLVMNFKNSPLFEISIVNRNLFITFTHASINDKHIETEWSTRFFDIIHLWKPLEHYIFFLQ